MNQKSRVIAPIAVVLAASLVLGALFLAVPSASALTKTSAPVVSSINDDGVFTVKSTITIGAGEFIPMNYVAVRTLSQSANISAMISDGRLPATTSDPGYCLAKNGAGGQVRATVTGTSASGSLNGYAKRDMSFTTGTFAGYGDAQKLNFASNDASGRVRGHATEAIQVTITATVTGCDFSALFDNSTAKPGEAKVFVQLIVGLNDTPGKYLRTVPVKKTFFDPDFAPAAADSTVSGASQVNSTVETTPTEDGGTAVEITYADSTNEGRAIPAGTALSTETGATEGATKVDLAVKNNISAADQPADSAGTKLNAMPSGTQVSVATADPADLSGTVFEQDEAALDDASDKAPIMAIQIGMSVPGKGSVDPAKYVEHLDVTIELDTDKFQNLAEAKLFKLAAFHDDGTRKASDPVRQSGPTANTATGEYTWVFRITSFSSFSGVIAKISSLPGDFDITDEIEVEATSSGNKISWNAATGAIGYQIWVKDGTSWDLLGETAADVLTFTHSAGTEDDEYKVTFFTDRFVGDGFGTNGTDVPGFEEDDTAKPHAHDDDGIGTWWIWLLIILFIILIVLLVIWLVLRARNEQSADDGDDWNDDWDSAGAAHTHEAGEFHTMKCPQCETVFDQEGHKPLLADCPGCGVHGILR